jgi:hypothetical protein
MKYLKAGTAAVILMGPAVDKTDGVTAETGLSPTVYLSKNGAAQGARNDATAITHDARGYYLVALDATDTNTAGRLRALFSSDADHLPVWEDYTVLPANVYDSLIAGSANLAVDATKVGGTVQTAGDLADLLDAIGTIVAAVLVDTGTDGVVVNAAGLSTDAVTEIVDAIKAAVIEAEGSYTIQQALSVILSVLAGVTASGGASLKTPNGVAVRVAATINTSSERTAMTLTPSA